MPVASRRSKGTLLERRGFLVAKRNEPKNVRATTSGLIKNLVVGRCLEVQNLKCL